MNFCSDNTTIANPEIVQHLATVNQGGEMPYGADSVTARLKQQLVDIFECDLEIFPVATGTAANVLSLSLLTPSFGAVLCHEESHINVDECGAPEMATGGAKLVPIKGENAKLTPAAIQEVLDAGWTGVVHHVQPSCVSITQATECGTVYSVDEVKAIADLAHANGLSVHMDGARFTNALVSLGCSPAEMTWKAGVDVLSFGATKNGALAAEVVILFNREKAKEAGFRRKRGGHLFSKMRFLSAQVEAYLTDDLWLRNARHANAMAAALAEGLKDLGEGGLLYPVQANEVFVFLPGPVAKRLNDSGFSFYEWPLGGPDCYRLVTAWCTKDEDVRRFIEVANK
ncbi:threonine aldolase family protein [Aestuariispira ectoiniformans]|uniref:threonine aldolase family protein n=1 Tax=Aestuariispira ectoiniformans TaxID=2775080 RepID=UPI00223A92FC|nr:low specificity L-threonine aldolase [Aestuariispira ectoiniformans]